MNLEQIIEEINRDIDDSLEVDELLGWVNRCMDDLSPVAKKESKIVYDISETNAYELPSDWMGTVLVMVNGKQYEAVPLNDTSAGYKVWGNVLSLQNGPSDGQIELYYYRRLAHLEKMEDVPEIEPSYHDLFVLYTVAHHQFMDDELEREGDAITRYNARRQEFQVFMQRKAPVIQTKIKDVYGWC